MLSDRDQSTKTSGDNQEEWTTTQLWRNLSNQLLALAGLRNKNKEHKPSGKGNGDEQSNVSSSISEVESTNSGITRTNSQTSSAGGDLQPSPEQAAKSAESTNEMDKDAAPLVRQGPKLSPNDVPKVRSLVAGIQVTRPLSPQGQGMNLMGTPVHPSRGFGG
jgi:hypothetical protein